MKTTRYAVLPLAGSAYKAFKGECLTHLTQLDEEGWSEKVMCRVKLEHVLDDRSLAEHNVPTCKTCAAKLAKLNLKPDTFDGDKVWVG